jgi:hypothetical protein
MDNKLTELNKVDQAAGQEAKSWQDKPDVLEVPSRQVELSERPKIRYGTISDGMDLARMVWPHGEHVFEIEKNDLSDKLPGRPKPAATYLTGQVPTELVKQSQLDCLLVDGDNANWLPWLDNGKNESLPSTIVWMISSSFIGNDKTGPMSSGRRKLMSPRGYSSKFWHLCAEEFGAALRQDRLAVVYYREKSTPGWGPMEPAPMNLPARAMINLLLPVGIPHKAWYQGQERDCTMDERMREFPCVVKQSVSRTPIHEHEGPMPDRANAWIRSERGVRRLQTCELAKAKGLTSEWTNKDSSKLENLWVGQSTCLHVWTAVMDSVSTWIHQNTGDQAQGKDESTCGPSENEEMRRQQAAASGTQEDWSWETPDLSRDGEWYKARVRSLKAAIAELPSIPNLFQEGLKTLKIHRQNYGTKGPKELQLIWWEFPRKSWRAIRDGSSMNFFITPGGALQPNSPMDEAAREVACKFVDELIRLRVLVPAEGEFKGNCLLFCVEKPHKAGAYRCIANAKTGEQNACMGRDPVYLVRSEDILPHLYEGVWSAKHFHNFQTRK